MTAVPSHFSYVAPERLTQRGVSFYPIAARRRFQYTADQIGADKVNDALTSATQTAMMLVIGDVSVTSRAPTVT